MVLATWKSPTGWSTPELKSYIPLSLFPTAYRLHYATECFECLKAYRGYDGKLPLLRAEYNAAWLNMSAARISLPQVDTLGLQKHI